ncbi:glycerate kinase [Oceanobacillus senegalensis]|uniref:glycerate kinase n=1 Tax=Oceanobacillus senegalensis TaxID=1936063 RepID=UPI000A30D06C|nr:glycerate kinase [Oceanobacillus senegalensis]
MKIVIAPDSFKGSLSAIEAANAINRGVKKAYPEAETALVPVADGGEGTMRTLIAATDGEIKKANVLGPLGEKVEAEYGVLGDRKTCVIEMATASGIDLVPTEKLSPLRTTTYGTGQLIMHALDSGYTSFILAIGGSATNDGGAGMLQALGLGVFDKNGVEIGFGGGELSKVHSIDINGFDMRIKSCTFLIASDVENPLVGPNGASHVFGPQKGANLSEVKLLDANLTHWAEKVEEITGVSLHNIPGAGAAGGIGGAFLAFFSAEMKPGIEVVLEYCNLERALRNADLVITGEGKVDYQTASGKTPLGVAKAAMKQNIPTIIVAGAVGEGTEVLHDYGIVSINSIVKEPMSLDDSMTYARELLAYCSEQVLRTYFYQTIRGRTSQCE